MKRKSEGQEQYSCQEVVGGYGKETEASSWPIKLRGVTSNLTEFTLRDCVCSNLHWHLPTSVCGQPKTFLPPLTTAFHTGVSAVCPQALHDSPPLHLCRHLPELSQLVMARIKRQINGVAWWQESDRQFWDRIQNLCRGAQHILCLPAYTWLPGQEKEQG